MTDATNYASQWIPVIYVDSLFSFQHSAGNATDDVGCQTFQPSHVPQSLWSKQFAKFHLTTSIMYSCNSEIKLLCERVWSEGTANPLLCVWSKKFPSRYRTNFTDETRNGDDTLSKSLITTLSVGPHGGTVVPFSLFFLKLD